MANQPEEQQPRATLLARLQEAEDMLRAIRAGEVDALAVYGEGGPQIRTLSGSEHPYRVLVESMSEGAVTLAADGRLLYVNPAFARLVSEVPKEIIGNHMQRYVLGDDTSIYTALLTRGLESSSKGEVRLAVSGTSVPVLMSFSTLKLEGPSCVCVVITDLREQKKNQESLAANQAKDVFLATLSHELRTPLSAILGWVGLLRESKTPQMVQRAVEVIERNAQTQAKLIDDILDMSRIISGKVALEMRTVNINSIVRAAIDSVRLAVEAKGIRLISAFDVDPAWVLGDTERLQQVVWNLLSNAIKFTPRGGTVEARVTGDEQTLHVTISDTGRGIGPDFLPFVFDPFRQADGSTTRRHGGLGLGLAIVRNLIEMHGGSVTATSPGEDQGSAFAAHLPRIGASASTQPGAGKHRSTPEELLAPLGGLHVLIVDDQPDTLTFLALSLQKQGARVSTASSAHEALACVAQDRPDVLISDIGMPEDDGYFLIHKLRATEEARAPAKPIPAIALTAFARSSDAEQALQAGFQRHIAKPVDIPLLVATICTLTVADESAQPKNS
jgi:PAS domain S-box-containing protein